MKNVDGDDDVGSKNREGDRSEKIVQSPNCADFFKFTLLFLCLPASQPASQLEPPPRPSITCLTMCVRGVPLSPPASHSSEPLLQNHPSEPTLRATSQTHLSAMNMLLMLMVMKGHSRIILQHKGESPYDFAELTVHSKSTTERSAIF